MDKINMWLGDWERQVERANEIRVANPSSVPPTSYMFHFPQLLRTHDPELNPMKLDEFSSGKGVGATVAKAFELHALQKPLIRPYSQFTETELHAAFGFSSIITKRGGPSPPTDAELLMSTTASKGSRLVTPSMYWVGYLPFDVGLLCPFTVVGHISSPDVYCFNRSRYFTIKGSR
jgi:hypothetical protein